MSHTEEVMTACDWCLQEALVQTIDDHLWRFWKIISAEDPIMISHRNICDKCKSRYEGFSIYIERCKINMSKIDELLSMGQVKDKPPVDIEYPPSPLIKKEISDEVDWNSYRPTVSSEVFIEGQMLAGCSYSPMKREDSTIDVPWAGKVKKEPFIDIQEHLINEGVWKEEASDPDFPTTSDGKGMTGLVLRVVLERQVLPDSIVLQKKVNNNRTCTYCGKTFNYVHSLKNHLRTHNTGEKPFKCPDCNKSFTQSGSLNVHLRTHTGEKPFKCSHCNKRFARFDTLNGHLRTHTGEKPFKCSHCIKRFARLSHLNRHLRTHTGDKPYKCSHCNNRFARFETLNEHLRTHTGEKPFKCSDCNRSFAQLSSLKLHLRTHTGEKSFKCSHCNKSFARSSSLNLHLLTHTGEKSLKCLHCNKSFARLGYLNSHLRTHTGEKSFKCSHCNKSFAHSTCFKYHSRIHTNDK